MHPRENTLRAITRSRPEWVPNGIERVIRLRPPIDERPTEAGLDAFGVSWSLDDEAGGETSLTSNYP